MALPAGSIGYELAGEEVTYLPAVYGVHVLADIELAEYDNGDEASTMFVFAGGTVTALGVPPLFDNITGGKRAQRSHFSG